MARFLLEALLLLIAVSIQSAAVSGLRCPCLVQGDVCGTSSRTCWKTSWFGDRDSYYDNLVPLWVKDSVTVNGNAGEKRKQELRDGWESEFAYRRELWYGWPACRYGYCDISYNNSVFEIMQNLQLGYGQSLVSGGIDVTLACVNVTLFPTPMHYKRFVGCGIVPKDPSKWELNDECREAGGMLSFGRGGYPNGSTFCIHNVTTAPASEAIATSSAGLPVLAPIVPATALNHQTSALVCPCQINATIASGYPNWIRVISSPSDDLASLTKALRSRAARERVCNYPNGSYYSDCDYERSFPEKLMIPFWPGCHNGRCEITRNAGEIWELMSDYQGLQDGVPGCITAVIANDTANGRRIDDRIHDLVRFRGCGIIPTEMVAPGTGTFCKLQMGLYGDEHLCILEYETASKSDASGQFPWLMLSIIAVVLLILAVAIALAARRLIQKHHISPLAGISVIYWNQKK